MERTARSVISFLVPAILCATVRAQPEVRTVDTGIGIPSNTVRAIVQDRNGLLWIGTGQGLCSYDGYEVTVTPFAAQGMSDYVDCIHIDRNDVMWVGTDDAFYSIGSHNDAVVRIDAVVNCIADDQEGNIWVGTRSSGVYLYNNSVDGEPVMRQFAKDKTVDEIFIDSYNALWVFCNDGTVLNYDYVSGAMQNVELNWGRTGPQWIIDVYQDPSGTMWLCTWDNGVFKMENGSRQVDRTPFSGVAGMNRIHIARNTEPYVLVVGSDDGLARLDLLSGTMRTDSRKKFIYAIMSDAENGLWIGSYYSGVHYRLLDDFRRFHTYPLSDSQECIVSCLAQTPDGSMWAGSDNLGVIRFDANTGQPTGHYLTDRNVHALLPWNGRMLVGSYAGGIDLLDYRTGRSSQLVIESVYSLATDHEGYLWFGTLDGIFRMQLPGGTPQLMCDRTGLVSSIKTGIDGTVWCATETNGLLSYSPVEGTWRNYTADEGIESSTINSLFMSDGGVLIAAGDKGFSYLLPGMNGFITVNTPGLEKVLYAASDMQNIWYTTTKGLNKYDVREQEFSYYGGETGLYDGGFIAGAGFVGNDGRIWLGTYKGTTSFHPGKIWTNTYSPPALITGMAFRTRIRAGVIESPKTIDAATTADEISMKHKYNNVSITYAALSYRVPQRNRYMTKLEGFDEEWTETDQRLAVYTNLPAGKYTFKVISSNSDGVWSDDETQVSFTIAPHFLLSPMAIIVYSILFVLLAVLAIYLIDMRIQIESERKLNSYVREFERSEKERRSMDFERRIRELIQQNLSNPDLSSEMLADNLYVSRSSLFAKVKEITGATPHQLIMDARLEEAARILSEGGHNVQDVCTMTGFNSSNYFSKCFKQKYGCNPRDWNNS